jgi:hypothetical protein
MPVIRAPVSINAWNGGSALQIHSLEITLETNKPTALELAIYQSLIG